MGFLGVYTALYDYAPQSDQELSLQEGDLLYVLEKSTEDEWWKAKKRAEGDEGDEPVGLIPRNYIQEAEPSGRARALYDYARQTDEEISLTEDAVLTVYDTSDADWTLVGLDGEYGFAPTNYIELGDTPSRVSSQRQPPGKDVDSPNEVSPPRASRSLSGAAQHPAAALAGIIHQKPTEQTRPPSPSPSPPSPDPSSRRPTFTPEASDDDVSASGPPPSLPARPTPQQVSSPTTPATVRDSIHSPRVQTSPPYNRAVEEDEFEPTARSPGGFHLYNISEMVSVMGKRKKMPTTLGLNVATGTIMIAPEKSRDGPQQEWTGDKLTHYSIEGKHVFLDLVRPSKSVDLHAGAKDTAEEIVSTLGEIAGAVRAEGLKEVLAAGSAAKSGPRKGEVLYDFVAQGDDEVTVGVGDEVVILDDTKSEEWWMVKRLKDGKEGVMPSSYVEVIRAPSGSALKANPLDAGRSVSQQNRLEEERLAKQAVKASRNVDGAGLPTPELGLGVALPKRGSSLMSTDLKDSQASQRSKSENKSSVKSSGGRSKPDASKIRTWTDRSGSFKVEAEFIGCTEGKIHLHKLNGVKIAVPVVKMAVQDLEFVEGITGMSLDDDKPLAEIKRRSQTIPNPGLIKATSSNVPSSKPPSTKHKAEKDEHDWFDFFLKCGVNPQLCERYSASFRKDSMDESVLPDINSEVLRTLGLKEGDILKVMKFLDNQYGRSGANRSKRNVSFGDTEVMQNGDDKSEMKAPPASSTGGGLFSGPGGNLRNNTRKGRPAPAIPTTDVVDPKVFEQTSGGESRKASLPTDMAVSPKTTAPPPTKKDMAGFDDDAWDVKPSKEERMGSIADTVESTSSAPPGAMQSPQPLLTDSMRDLSLLSAPLQPVVAQPTSLQSGTQAPSMNVSSSLQPSQPPTTAAGYLPGGPAGPSQQVYQSPQRAIFALGGQPNPGIPQTGFAPQQTPSNMPSRVRPQAPPQPVQNPASFMIPPPPRPLSAPQNNSQQSSFAPPPLQPQLTGVQGLGFSLQPRLGSGPPNFQNQGPAGLPSFAPPTMPSQMYGPNQPMNALAMQPTGPGMVGMGLVPQPTGFPPMSNSGSGPGFQGGRPFINGQMTNYSMANSQPTGNLSSLAPQPTGPQYVFSSSAAQQQQQQQQPPPPPPLPPLPGNVNAFLPPALQPQPTGVQSPGQAFGQAAVQSHPTGFTIPTQSFGQSALQSQATGMQMPGSNFGQPIPPVPPIPPIPPVPQQPTLAPLQPQKTGPAPPVRFGVAPEAKKLVPQPTGRRANLSQATPQNPFGF